VRAEIGSLHSTIATVLHFGPLVHRKACCCECASVLTQEVSSSVVVFYVERALVRIVADGIQLRLFEVSDQMPGLVEVPSYVKELHAVAWHLSPGPLAHRARCELGNFELLPIAVPLIERLKQLVRAMEIVDPP